MIFTCTKRIHFQMMMFDIVGGFFMIEFNKLVNEFPDVPLYKMGFPPNWKSFKIFSQ